MKESSLVQIFEQNARWYGDEPAVEYEDRSLTHGQLWDRGCRLANALVDIGLRKQDRVSILSMNNLEFYEAYVGCWIGGFIAATVNFRLPESGVIEIVADSDPRVLIVEEQYRDMVPGIRAAVPGIEKVLVIGEPGEGTESFEAFVDSGSLGQPRDMGNGGDIGCLIYTSGTTGKPKGCMLGQREESLVAAALVYMQGNRSYERFLCVMPLFHVGGLAVSLSALYVGGCCVVMRQFDAAEVARRLEEDRITLALMAPTMVHQVLEVPGLEDRDFSKLRLIAYSAAPMPTTVLRRGLKVFGPIFLQLLGSTENGGMAFLPEDMHRPDGTPREQQRLLSAGIPTPSVQIGIFDDDRNPLPVGEAGEIAYKSPLSLRGYWNDSAATAASFQDGWFFGGDIGKFDEDGYLYLVDRKKDMIISGGENIFSREVEEAILTHDAVDEVAVVGKKDDKWGEIVVACIIPKEGKSATADEIIEHVRAQIASYKKPREVVFMKELPKLASGKVDKKVIRAELA